MTFMEMVFWVGLTLEKMLWYRGFWFLPIAFHS